MQNQAVSINNMTEPMCPLHGWRPNQTEEVVWKLLLAEEEQETLYKLPTFVLLCVLMVVGLPGNILVLLVYGFRFPASTTKSFIMAMAVFDLINCVVGMPFEMVDLRYDMKFDIPVACKIIRFWITLSACGSVTVLLAVSIDRFRRICRAFHKQMTIKQSRFLIGALALVSVLFALPALILYGRHTEKRYNMELHDCSIDDDYKSTLPASAYQYILGATWVICIVILVIMYSLIIYKINLQKKRRERLSNQSCDSTVFNRLKKLSNETCTSDKHKNTPRPSIENGSLLNCERNSETRVKLRSSDANDSMSLTDDDVSMDERNSRLVHRMFSRDVNPILEDAEDNGQGDEVNYCDTDEENMSLPGLSCNVRLIKSTRTSLNNYLASSQETELANRSTSLIQDTTPEEAGTHHNSEDSDHSSVKVGHPLGRHRSWESEQLMREISFISSALEREWASQGDDISDTFEESGQNACCHIRRVSSQCNLTCAGQDLGHNQTHTFGRLHGEHKYDINTEVNDDNIIDDFQKNSDNSNKDSDSASPLLMPMNGHSHYDAQCNIKQDCSESSNVNNVSGEDKSLHCRDFPKIQVHPLRKSKSPSIFAALSIIKKKKSSAREIKTSKVSIMMLMVTAGFVLSYLPHLGIQFFKSLFPSTVARLLCTNQAYFVVHHFLMRFFFINNAINPIIYSFYNKTFRDRCLRILKSPKALIQSSQHFISNINSISQDNDTS